MMKFNDDASLVVLAVLLILDPCSPLISEKQLNNGPSGGEADMSAEKRLIQKLMATYARIGRAGRPVRNSSMVVTVHFGLGLKQMDLDEKQNILTLNMWTRYEWEDEYLHWNVDEFDGLSRLTLNPRHIWTPDIMLINTADIGVPTHSAMVVVNNMGIVTWFPNCIYHSTCSVDVTNFPFDLQKCNLAFGSWTHPSKEINIVLSFAEGIDLSTYNQENKESSAWDILNVTAKRIVLPSEEEYPSFVVLTFELVFSRKIVFTTFILTLSCVFLAFLTLVVFWLPPEISDRTAFAMSIFSSFMVLLLILVKSAPSTTRTIPTLGVFYCINMVIIVMAVVLSTLVINFSCGPRYQRSRPSKCLKVILLHGLSRLLCMPSVYNEVKRRSLSSHNAIQEETEAHQHMLVPRQSSFNGCDLQHRKADCRPQLSPLHQRHDEDRDDSIRDSSLCLESIRSEMEQIRHAVERLEQKLCQNKEQSTGDVLWEWTLMAVVLDRFFFVLYVIIIGLSLVLFFPRPQQNIEWGDN